jgi:hypothetical protein
VNAVLLCPGPSLSAYTPGGHGLVVAVNRAATLHRCNVWSAIDTPTLKTNYGRTVTPAADLRLLTIAATAEKADRTGWRFRSVITHDTLAGGAVDNGRHPWTRYSATAGLFYAIHAGATRVDVYGADMQGEQDWDGVLAGETRNNERWERELAIWNKLAETAEVIRHGLPE